MIYKNFYGNPTTHGIIFDLSASDVLPIDLTSEQQESMNLNFYSLYKNLESSVMIDTLVEIYGITDNLLNTDSRTKVIKAIDSTYKEKWAKLYALEEAEYNPLKPYLVEVDDDVVTDHMTTNTTNETTNHVISGDNSVYGFNSEYPVPMNNENSSTEYTDTVDYSRDSNSSRKIKREGNIGNISPQDLIEKQRKVLSYVIWDVIFKDISTILFCGTYGSI